MNAQLALALPSSAPSNTLVINARCTLRVEEHQRVIVVGGLPVHHYGSDDAVAEAYAMVLLVDSGFARQTEVARAFGKSVLKFFLYHFLSPSNSLLFSRFRLTQTY